MSTKVLLILIGSLILLSFVTGAVVYSHLPERGAAHWNAAGEVDGYTSRFGAAYTFPILTLGMSAILLLIPVIDPLKANIGKFRGPYNVVILALVVYLLYLYAMTLYTNLVGPFNIVVGMIPAFALLDLALGYLLGRTQPNWTIGIRTPWTLSSPTVWAKTHKLGARLFTWAGVVTLAGLLFPGLAFVFLIGPILAVAVYTCGYSYFAYQQETRRQS